MVCRYHGARKPETIMRGVNHPQYRHGEETLEAKAERSLRLSELRDLEAIMFEWGVASGAKWRGRKPLARHPTHRRDEAENNTRTKCDVK